MANVAKAQIIGRVVSEIEQRPLPNSGTVVTKFRVASGRSKKSPDGSWEEDPNTLYLDVKAFDYADSKRKLGEIAVKYLKKGDPVFLEGDLQTESWEDKSGGGKRSKVVLKINEIQLLGGKSDAKPPINAEDPGETFAPPKQPQRPQPKASDDEIPF